MFTDIYPNLLALTLRSKLAFKERRFAMPSFSPNMRLCATCERWAGPRKLNSTRSVVTTGSIAVKGECLGGGHNHAQTPPTATCAKHVKWPVLK